MGQVKSKDLLGVIHNHDENATSTTNPISPVVSSSRNKKLQQQQQTQQLQKVVTTTKPNSKKKDPQQQPKEVCTTRTHHGLDYQTTTTPTSSPCHSPRSNEKGRLLPSIQFAYNHRKEHVMVDECDDNDVGINDNEKKYDSLLRTAAAKTTNTSTTTPQSSPRNKDIIVENEPTTPRKGGIVGIKALERIVRITSGGGISSSCSNSPSWNHAKKSNFVQRSATESNVNTKDENSTNNNNSNHHKSYWHHVRQRTNSSSGGISAITTTSSGSSGIIPVPSQFENRRHQTTDCSSCSNNTITGSTSSLIGLDIVKTETDTTNSMHLLNHFRDDQSASSVSSVETLLVPVPLSSSSPLSSATITESSKNMNEQQPLIIRQGGSIHKQLIRSRGKKIDFDCMYEIMKEIGQGGLCKIYQIRRTDVMMNYSSDGYPYYRHHHRRKQSHFSRFSPSSFKSITMALQSFNNNSKKINTGISSVSTSSSSIRQQQTKKNRSNNDLFLLNMDPIIHNKSEETYVDRNYKKKIQNMKNNVLLIPSSKEGNSRSEEGLEDNKNKKNDLKSNDVPYRILPETTMRQEKLQKRQHVVGEGDDDKFMISGIEAPPTATTSVLSSDIHESALPLQLEVPSTQTSSLSLPLPPLTPILVPKSDESLERTNSSSTGNVVAMNSEKSLSNANTNESKSLMSHLYFALKVINLAFVKEDKIDQLKNEVDLLKGLDHPNIIKVYETFQSKHNNKNIMIVMELCTGGDLRARYPYTEQQVAIVLKHLLNAVSYLHTRGIVHRDIKLENIMYESDDPEAAIRLIDFGISKLYSNGAEIHPLSERVGTLSSMSPETLKGEYSYKADLWSIGVCTYMLLSHGKQPFDGVTPKQVISSILSGKYTFEDPDTWNVISDEAKDFVQKLLVVDPVARMSAEEALHHPWIKNTSRQMNSQKVESDLKQRVQESMVRYSEYSNFMKLTMNVIAKKSTSADIFHLRRVFEEYDTTNSGTLTLPEFREAMKQFQYDSDDVDQIFHRIDINRTNEIDYTEFLASTLEAQGVIEEHRIADAFDMLDDDDSGYISRENLRRILGDDCSEQYIDRLVEEIGIIHDSVIKIPYTMFLRIFEEEKKKIMYKYYKSSFKNTKKKQLSMDSNKLLEKMKVDPFDYNKRINSESSISTLDQDNTTSILEVDIPQAVNHTELDKSSDEN